jgi:hypothetical protein
MSDAVKVRELAGRLGYWLVFGGVWPEGTPASGMAVAVVAVSPWLVPRAGLSPGAADVLAVAEAYAPRLAPDAPVVFLGELTRWLAEDGQTWAGRGVAWAGALDELVAGDWPVRWVTVTSYAHAVVCGAGTRECVIQGPHGPVAVTERMRDDMRAAIAAYLHVDWWAPLSQIRTVLPG